MSGLCDVDPPAFYSWSEPVARKFYPCRECCAPILKGERHFACVGKWEGSVERIRQHLLCCQACELIRDELSNGECVCFGGLMEEFDELRGNGWHTGRERYRDAWHRLRALLARIKWRERPYRTRRRPHATIST